MKNIKPLISFFVTTVITTHGMDQTVPTTPGSWNKLTTDTKTSIVAMSKVKDKKNLRFVNKELAQIACKANIPTMLTHYPCILNRADHLHLMIHYSKQKDTDTQNIITHLIKNAPFCNHADVLDITNHFFPEISDKENVDNAIKTENFSLLKEKNDALALIPIYMQTYKQNQANKSLALLMIPKIMDIYGDNEAAINRYIKKHYQGQKITTPLHIAVENDHTEVAELFMMQNPHLLYRPDSDGMIPLAIAAQKGNAKIITLLQKCSKRNKIENKTDIPFTKSPYFFATRDKHRDCLQLLLDQKPDYIDSLHHASLSLLPAVSTNDIATIEMLLARPDIDINAKESSGHSSIHVCVLRNHIAPLRLLLAKNALLNEKDITGSTPLMLAVQNDALGIAELLVKQPTIDINSCIDPNLELVENFPGITDDRITLIKNSIGLSPLCCAANNGNDAMVQLLLDNGASPYNTVRHPLIRAVIKGHYNIVKKIVTHCPESIHYTMSDRNITALYAAITVKRKDIVEYLLDNGAQLNECCITSMPPLLAAVDAGDLEIVTLLVKKGADINYQGTNGETAIGLAVYKKHQPIIDFLLSQPGIIIR